MRSPRDASRAGAGWFGAGVLFLMPASREQFLPFLQKKVSAAGANSIRNFTAAAGCIRRKAIAAKSRSA